jgi:hypothetical protein
MFARIVVMLWVALAALWAHDVITTKLTWSKEISRLVYKRCASCHKPGGSAPMSLLTYEEARPWAKAIKEEVLERRMPPWGAVKGFGEFKHDRGLTQEEVELIANWVEGGAPEGNPIYLPSKPNTDSPANATPSGATQLALSGALTLSAPARLVAIRPAAFKTGASVQVVARKPDGSVEPLIWLYDYRPKFRLTYWLESPLALPAGTKIEMTPPGGSLTLFARAR